MKEAGVFTHFLERAAADGRFSVTHISLFAAIFHLWVPSADGFFKVSRKKLMRYAKLRSFVTYHKRVSELAAWGYILYEPSYHPRQGSRMAILSL